MRNVLLLVSISFLFIGCSSSYLKLSNNALVLNYNKQSIHLANEPHKQTRINLINLYVDQYTLDKNGSTLFYEDVSLNTKYKFKYNNYYNLEYIFNAKINEVLYQDSNLMLVQLELKEKKYINLLLESSISYFRRYVYGYSNEEFISLATQLNQKNAKLKPLKNKAIKLNTQMKPYSEWSYAKLFINPLIKRKPSGLHPR